MLGVIFMQLYNFLYRPKTISQVEWILKMWFFSRALGGSKSVFYLFSFAFKKKKKMNLQKTLV